jgi:hypothetical protein
MLPGPLMSPLSLLRMLWMKSMSLGVLCAGPCGRLAHSLAQVEGFTTEHLNPVPDTWDSYRTQWMVLRRNVSTMLIAPRWCIEVQPRSHCIGPVLGARQVLAQPRYHIRGSSVSVAQ